MYWDGGRVKNVTKYVDILGVGSSRYDFYKKKIIFLKNRKKSFNIADISNK